MKINTFPALIALVAAALLAYLFYTISGADAQMSIALAISGFVSMLICLGCGIGITFKDSHHTVNSFAASSLFAVLLFAEHLCFALWGSSVPLLIIFSGLLLVLYLLVFYGISKAKM